MLHRSTCLIALTLTLLLGAPGLASAASVRPGDVDRSFGSLGFVAAPNGKGQGGVAVQRDGKVVVAGVSSETIGVRVRRYTARGTLDPSFGGGDGLTTITALSQASVVDVLLDPAGGIYVGGIDYAGCRVFVARLTDAGSLDPSWASASVTPGVSFHSNTVPCAVNLPSAARLARASNGEVYVAVTEERPATEYDAALYAFTAAGASNGSNWNTMPGGQSVHDVLVIGDYVLLIGDTDPSWLAVTGRSFESATRDSFAVTFRRATLGAVGTGTSEMSGASRSDELRAAQLLPDGSVALVGMMRDGAVHYRLTIGRATVDAAGVVVVTKLDDIDPFPHGWTTLRPSDIAVDTLGRLLVAGASIDAGAVARPFVARLRPSLAMDPGFNGGVPRRYGGITQMLLPMGFTTPMAIASAPSGAAVLVTEVATNDTPSIMRVRSSLADAALTRPRAGSGSAGARIASSLVVRSNGPDPSRMRVVLRAPRGTRFVRASIGGRRCAVTRQRVTCQSLRLASRRGETIRLTTISSRTGTHALVASAALRDTIVQSANSANDVVRMRLRIVA